VAANSSNISIKSATLTALSSSISMPSALRIDRDAVMSRLGNRQTLLQNCLQRLDSVGYDALCGNLTLTAHSPAFDRPPPASPPASPSANPPATSPAAPSPATLLPSLPSAIESQQQVGEQSSTASLVIVITVAAVLVLLMAIFRYVPCARDACRLYVFKPCSRDSKKGEEGAVTTRDPDGPVRTNTFPPLPPAIPVPVPSYEQPSVHIPSSEPTGVVLPAGYSEQQHAPATSCEDAADLTVRRATRPSRRTRCEVPAPAPTLAPAAAPAVARSRSRTARRTRCEAPAPSPAPAPALAEISGRTASKREKRAERRGSKEGGGENLAEIVVTALPRAPSSSSPLVGRVRVGDTGADQPGDAGSDPVPDVDVQVAHEEPDQKSASFDWTARARVSDSDGPVQRERSRREKRSARRMSGVLAAAPHDDPNEDQGRV
jgi:hypothetical protein